MTRIQKIVGAVLGVLVLTCTGVVASILFTTGPSAQAAKAGQVEAFSSLKEAAAQPHGPGVKEIAKDARLAHQKVDPKTVLPNTADENYNGCSKFYGNGSSTCLPVTSPMAAQMGMTSKQMPWTCTQMRVYFPKGIELRVAKADPLHLDKNGDGVACGIGD